MVDKAFDKSQFKQIEGATKKMTQQYYDLCLYRCDEKVSDDSAACK